MIAIAGETGTGKTTLALSIICEKLAEGRAAAIITTDAPPEAFIERCKSICSGIGTSLREENIFFLDCYSWRVGTNVQKRREKIISIGGLDNLGALAIKVEEILERKPALVLLDSLSTFSLHSGEKEVLRFLEVFAGRIRAAGLTAMVIMESGVQSKEFEKTINSISDGIIETKFNEESDDIVRHMRIRSMKNARHVSKWTKFAIGENGINLPPV